MADQIQPPNTSVEELFKQLGKVHKNPNVKFKKQTRLKAKEIGTVRITNDKIDVSKASSEGPSLFGFRFFKWFFVAYNAVLDFFYFRKFSTYLKVPLYKHSVDAAVSYKETVRMHKIGEIDRSKIGTVKQG